MVHPPLNACFCVLGLLAFLSDQAYAKETPQLVETLTRSFPFTADNERITGEFNGLQFLSSRGTTPESPRAALARLQSAFGPKQTISLVAPGGDAAIYWQALGMQKLTGHQKKQLEKVLKETAMQLTVAAYRTSLPPIWAHDMLCTLEVLDWPTCAEPDPLALLVAMQRALPNLLWHAVTLTRRDGKTHFTWSVWPEIDLGGLFASADPEERKALCKRAKFPRLAQAACPVIASFATGETSARVELMEQPAPTDTARQMIARELLADGWLEEESAAASEEFQQYRHPQGRRSLMLFVRAREGGSSSVFVESGEAP